MFERLALPVVIGGPYLWLLHWLGVPLEFFAFYVLGVVASFWHIEVLVFTIFGGSFLGLAYAFGLPWWVLVFIALLTLGAMGKNLP